MAKALESLLRALQGLPGVGAKSASRMAFHLLQHDRDGALELARALTRSVAELRHCTRCYTFTDAEVCPTCTCLLYTSDASDELDGGDLCGRRII